MTRLRLATRKHRIGLARIIAVIAEAHTVSDIVTDRGREIEVIVVSGEGFDLVIHAMPVDYRRRSR